MIAKLIIDDRDQLWIFGQPDAKGFPFMLCNAKGKTLQSGVLARLPVRISNNTAYTFDFTGNEEGLLRLEPLSQSKR